jgi:hypothetical protein
MVIMGLILLASGFALFGGVKTEERAPTPVAATNLSAS